MLLRSAPKFHNQALAETASLARGRDLYSTIQDELRARRDRELAQMSWLMLAAMVIGGLVGYAVAPFVLG